MVNYPSGFRTPPNVYTVSVVDTPGVVTGNNFLSLLNPASSTFVHVALQLIVSVYAVASSATPNSLLPFRTTAHSGGSLLAPANVSRFTTTDPDPVTSVRTGNPTVSASAVPLASIPPVISTGVGNSGVGNLNTPPGASFNLLAGQGIVFNTAAGNANQVWNLTYTWAEVPL